MVIVKSNKHYNVGTNSDPTRPQCSYIRLTASYNEKVTIYVCNENKIASKMLESYIDIHKTQMTRF